MFSHIIGIDQTGAVYNNKPKPLKTAIFDVKNKSLIVNKKVNSLNVENISDLIHTNSKNKNYKKVLILLDASLGLPNSIGIKIRALIALANNFKYKNNDYGLVTANQFYKSLLKTKSIPRREIDILLETQSVFSPYPFQRNIACGSYRILKDIFNENFAIWPFEKIENANFIIAEGYPSYYWKVISGQKNRNLKLQNNFFKNNLLSKEDCIDLDFADAATLAIYPTKINITSALNYQLSKNAKHEGWILGYQVPQKVR